MSLLPRFVFYSQGNCWSPFRLPSRQLYYSGHMVHWSWWRFALVWESFTKRPNCTCPSCRPRCAHCNNMTEKDWHFVCQKCWDDLPKPLQDELIASHAEQVGSERHRAAKAAVREALESRCDNCREPGAEWRQHPMTHDRQEGDVFLCLDCFKNLEPH